MYEKLICRQNKTKSSNFICLFQTKVLLHESVCDGDDFDLRKSHGACQNVESVDTDCCGPEDHIWKFVWLRKCYGGSHIRTCKELKGFF